MAIDRAIPPVQGERPSLSPRQALHSVLFAAIPALITSNIVWFGLYTFVNGYLVHELGKSNEQWTAATLFFTGGMVFVPGLAIELSSRIGRRRVVILGILFGAAFYGLLGFTTSFPAILALMAVASFMPVVGDVALFPLIADVCGEQAGKAFASVMLLSVILMTTSLMAGGYLIEALSFRASFHVFSATCLVCAIAFAFLSRGMSVRQQTKVTQLSKLSRSDISTLLRGPFLAILVLGSSAPCNWHTANQLYPNLGRDIFRLPEHTIAMVVALGRLPALLVLLVLAHRIDRLNAVTVVGLGIGLAGLFVGAIGLAREIWLYVAFYAMYFTAQGVFWGSMSAAVNTSAPTRLRDSAFALMSVVSTVATVLVGLVHNRLLAGGMRLEGVFVVCGTIGCFCGMALAVYSRMRGRYRTTNASLDKSEKNDVLA